MQIIFAAICFFGAIATMIFVKSLDLSAGLTIAIVVPLVCLVIYSLARIKPKKRGAEKDAYKWRIAEISEKAHVSKDC